MPASVDTATLPDMDERDTVSLSIRLPRHLHQQLVEAARLDLRSVNSEALVALEQGLRLLRVERRERERREREEEEGGAS